MGTWVSVIILKTKKLFKYVIFSPEPKTNDRIINEWNKKND